MSQAYSTALLKMAELKVLHDLRDYGLIYQPSVRPYFDGLYLTNLASPAHLISLLPHTPRHNPHLIRSTPRLLLARRRRAWLPHHRDQLQSLRLHLEPSPNCRAQPLCRLAKPVPESCHGGHYEGQRQARAGEWDYGESGEWVERAEWARRKLIRSSRSSATSPRARTLRCGRASPSFLRPSSTRSACGSKKDSASNPPTVRPLFSTRSAN
mgnify:CR=1 FL=1